METSTGELAKLTKCVASFLSTGNVVGKMYSLFKDAADAYVNYTVTIIVGRNIG